MNARYSARIGCHAGERSRGVLPKALIGLGVLLVACSTSDSDYERYVNARLALGPEEACCRVRFVTPSLEEADACRRDALVRCAFVAKARVEKLLYVSRFGEGTGAMVSARVSGPNGSGSCSFQVYSDGQVDGGRCDPDP